VVFLRRCIVRLLLLPPHRAAADRPKLVAAAREDQGRAATAGGHAEEQVTRLLCDGSTMRPANSTGVSRIDSTSPVLNPCFVWLFVLFPASHSYPVGETRG